jgi:hypothetical protein
MPEKGMEMTQLVSLVLGEQGIQAGHLRATEAAPARRFLRPLHEDDWRNWILDDRSDLVTTVLNGKDPIATAEILVRKKRNMPAQLTFGF